MKSFARKVYQRVGVLGLSFVLALSSIGAAAPIFFSQAAHAAPATSYVSAPLNTLSFSTDRQAPSGGYSTSGNTLTLNVDNTQANTSSTFYQTEGVQAPIATSQTIKADLYVDPAWSGKSIRAGLWGVAGSSTASDVAWPIIEYTTVGSGSFTGFRIFDTMNGGWTNLTGVTVTPGQTYTLEISYNGGTDNYDYYVNDVKAGSLPASDGTDVYGNLKAVIFDNYNFATGNHANDYTVQWSNFSEGTHSLSTPTNLTPGNNSYTNDPAFSMTWNTVAGASKYEYRTSNTEVNSTTLGTIIYSDSSATAGNYDLGATTITRHNSGTPEGNYYWQVRAGDNDGHWSDWSVINKVSVDTTAPSKPVLDQPSNGALLNTNEFDFNWNDSTDASPVTYEFQASQDPSHDSNQVLNGGSIWHSGVLPTSMIHSSGAGDGAWYYQVRAKDAAGNYSLWSDIWSVNLDTHAPNAPTLVSPSNNAVVNGASVTQSWSDTSTDIDHYVYESFNDAAATQVRWIQNFTTTSKTATNVADGTTYWWKVLAVDHAGNVSAASPLWKITIDNTAPVVHITSQSNGDVLRGSVTMSGTVTDANPDHYYFVVKDSHGHVVAGPGTVNQANVSNWTWNTTGVADGNYTIDLEARDAANNKDASSVQTVSVTVDNTAPVVSVTAPAAGAYGFVNTAHITANIGDAVSYRILVNGNPVATGTGAFVPYDLSVTDGTYNIQVEGTDAAGNVGTSTVTTITVDDTAPLLTANGYTGTSLTPTITGTTNGATDLVTVDGNAASVSSTVNGSGTYDWTYTFPTQTVGTHNSTVVSTDTYGNATSKSVIVAVNEVQATQTTPASTNTTVTPTGATTNNTADQGVLGATTDNTANNGDTGVKGATDTAAATDTPASNNSAFSLAWYWWLLIIAAIAAIIWGIVAAIRRRNNQEA